MRPALRRPLVVGNWKLFKNLAEARALCDGLRARIPAADAAEAAIAPVFTALSVAREALAGSSIALAAQDVYWEREGAFTGEVSAPLLADAGCRFVIVGHSERRALFRETDTDVRRKLLAVIEAGMTPIACVGESLAQREAGEGEAHVLGQVGALLSGVPQPAAASVVLAYEPIWAIGTGKTARPEDAQAMHERIRARVAEQYGLRLADRLRILYGGSVKPDNARALMRESDVDGALVGGASLDAESFASIVAAARPA